MSGFGRWILLAKLKINAMDDLAVSLDKMLNQEMCKKIVWAGAQPVANEIRTRLKENLKGSKKSKGDLLDSLGIAPPAVDDNGATNTKIGFDGYDRKGVANALKARAMESGTSTQKKKPFVRPAVDASYAKSIEAMQTKYNELTESEE